MPSDNPNLVSSPSSTYLEMRKDWDLVLDLWGGTDSMRENRDKYLPKETNETTNGYNSRVFRSYLYEAFKDTTQTLVSKPFSRKVNIEQRDKIHDQLQLVVDNCDGAGRDTTQFARDLFISGIKWGLVHVLIDYPKMPEEASRAVEIDAQARPIFIEISPTNLIGWKTATAKNGQPVLVEIRYLEVRNEPVGKYADEDVKYIRIYRPTDWELWRLEPGKDEKDENSWKMSDSGTHTFGSIPLKTCYVNRTGFMQGISPLQALAWMNLAHFQSSSDYRNGVRYTTHAILFQKGISKAEADNPVEVGPTALIRSTNPEADMKYVEHQGKGLGSARTAIQDMEDQMTILGMRPMVSKSGDITATGKAIDEAQTFTDIQAWIRSLESFLGDCFKVAAEWIKTKLPTDFKIDINNDFGISGRDAAKIAALQHTRLTGEITQETYLEHLKRYRVLDEFMNVQDELEKTQSEAVDIVGEVEIEE